MKTDFDIAVIGSGFAGSLMAMIAKRQDRSVVLLEKGRHPRFAIGESSTPLANLLLEELARTYDLPQLLPLTKWGTWQRDHPELACGLKRGFTFYHHRFDEPYAVDPERHRLMLVAASPHDAIADTHWFRADLDAWLVRQAQTLGVDYWDEVDLRQVTFDAEGGALKGWQGGGRIDLRARMVIDATGPRGLLHQQLGLGEEPFPDYPSTPSLFTHFTGVKRFDASFDLTAGPPYPPDDAAVHHVFPGGWMWVLRFNNGITSAGVSVNAALAQELRLSEGEPAWHRLLQRLPSVRALFVDARPVRPFVHQAAVAFRSAQMAGPNWALLPSAAGFVDPLLSTGIPLTLLGVQRLGKLIGESWLKPELASGLEQYGRETNEDLIATAALIGALLAHLDDPAMFNSLSQIYFAAASYGEAARRVGRGDLAPGFLLRSKPEFGQMLVPWLRSVSGSQSSADRAALLTAIPSIISRINVAGLCQPERRNWYGCLAEDLLAGAAKIGKQRADVEALLERSGFYQAGETR